MNAIYELLQNSREKILTNNNFWSLKTLDELLHEQHVNPVQTISDLFSDFWHEEETVDEFNNFIYQQRQNERINN